jgi:thiamine transport system ATP-binding protein
VSSSEPRLSVKSLSTAWHGRPVVRSVSFDVAPGELVALLGPNGSGKTTLLRTIAGLEAATHGQVRLDGADLSGVPTRRRGIALMLQEAALFPHRTVFENIAYAPLLRRAPRAEVDRIVTELVRLLRLAGFEDRAPDTLSGGERQRVALARTLAARPRVVLLDEPFASLDVEVKAELRTEFRRALRAMGTAAVHVTHDREEGFFLGDRVGLLFDGQLEAWGPPEEVFEHPTSERAARFLGYNVLSGPAGPVAALPQDVSLAPSGGGRSGYRVVASGSVGAEALVILRAPSGERVELRSPEPFERPPIGADVAVTWRRERALGGPRVDPPTMPKWSADVPGA